MFLTVFKWLWSALPTVFGFITNTETAKLQARATTATALGTEATRAQTSYMTTAMDHWETRWLIALTSGAVVFHLCAIVLDSIFHMHWQIAALPKPFDSYEGTILLAPFALSGALGVARTVLNIFK